MESLVVFMGPDHDSTDGTTGERVEKVPGGWLILNHGTYRDRQTHTQELTAARVRRHRAKKLNRDTCNDETEHLQTSPPEAEAEADAEGIASLRSAHVSGADGEPVKLKQQRLTSNPPGFDEFWPIYPKKVGKQAAIKTWSKVARTPNMVKKILAGALAFRAAVQQKEFVPNPAT